MKGKDRMVTDRRYNAVATLDDWYVARTHTHTH